MKPFLLGALIGTTLASVWVFAQRPAENMPPTQEQIRLQGYATPAMPGGVKPDGRVYFIQLDKDGYVLATCRNQPK
jgi:hypothetical protein